MSYLIEEHLTALRSESRSTKTIRDRRRCLRRLHEDLPYGLLGASTADLRAWLAYEKWSANTRYTYAGHIIQFYRWLKEEGRRDQNPAASIRRPAAHRGLPRPWSDAQLETLLTAPEPLRTAVILAAFEGMRLAEICACRREHITEDWVTIPDGKGGKPGMVPTHPMVWEHVRGLPPGPLIVDRRGHLSADQLSDIARRWQRSHGLPCGLHPGRHRFATEIQRQARDIRVTQEAMRHKSINSTQVYTQVSDQDRIAAVRALRSMKLGPGSSRPEPPAHAA